MFWFARYEKRQIIECKDAIRERFIMLCVEDKEFADAITLGTADPARVRTRFKKWEEILEEVITTPANERRAFSFDEKNLLFEANRTCAVCGQQIETVDDAEVDHQTPYVAGGSTNLSNAQLTHRFCNRSKGAKKTRSEAS
jgi:5-methylcytosine-specific restriction endonuclease McrA